MELYSLCYPDLGEQDNQFIADFRNKHDELHREVVEHHFTMVFGVADQDQTEYIKHVENIAEKQFQITFSCRYAMLHNDAFSDYYYVFLVPDEGYSDISKFHDNLYTGILESSLLLDVPYTPHIGIASSLDKEKMKQLCDELNQGGIEISGKINEVTVGSLEADKITNIKSIGLGKF